MEIIEEVLPEKICRFIGLLPKLERPDVGELEGAEDLLDVEEAALVLAEVDVVAALEVDLDEDQALVVLAEDGLEEAAAAEDLLEDEVVGRREVVEVVLGGRHLGGARNLVPHGCFAEDFGIIRRGF